MAIMIVSLAGFALFFWQHKPKPREFKSTEEIVEWLAAQAVEDAWKNNHIRLDYAVESIRTVDTILGGLHDQYVHDPKSVSVNGLGSAYGAYVGEVIRRSEPNVKWQSGDDAAREKSYPLIWSGGHLYPMAWCYHRIVNGDEDNVWIKYSVLKQQAETK